MNFDSAFFFLFGIFTITMGILNKGILFWTSIHAHNNDFDQKYKKGVNIIMGIISIAIGLALYNN